MKEVKIETIVDNLNNLNIIDVRDNYLYNMDNIPYSKNIPASFLMMNPEYYLDKDKTYYIYCNLGITSKKVCEMLSSKGYNVINIIGGFNEYKKIHR